MRVGWLMDSYEYTGGAELTMREFAAAAPDNVELVDCPPGEVTPGVDRYVIGNCVAYTLDDLAIIEDRPAVKYWHDVGPWVALDVRELLDTHAQAVCCSPVQAEYMGLTDAIHIPPAVDLGRFEDAAAHVNGSRGGAVSVGQWRNLGKAAHRVMEWSHGNDTRVDFYGGGPFAPEGSTEIAYDDMPGLLAGYQTFVFLPTVLEPFGRTVAEAWAAGCEIVTNQLVGAAHWIETDPGAIETAGADFWELVMSA